MMVNGNRLWIRGGGAQNIAPQHMFPIERDGRDFRPGAGGAVDMDEKWDTVGAKIFPQRVQKQHYCVSSYDITK